MSNVGVRVPLTEGAGLSSCETAPHHDPRSTKLYTWHSAVTQALFPSVTLNQQLAEVVKVDDFNPWGWEVGRGRDQQPGGFVTEGSQLRKWEDLQNGV